MEKGTPVTDATESAGNIAAVDAERIIAVATICEGAALAAGASATEACEAAANSFWAAKGEAALPDTSAGEDGAATGEPATAGAVAAGGTPLVAAEGRVAVVADASFGKPATAGAMAVGGTPSAAAEGRVAFVADAFFEEVAVTKDGLGTTAGTNASDGVISVVFDGTDAPFEGVEGTDCPATCRCTVAVEGSPLAAAAGTAPAGMLPCMLCEEGAMLDEGSATGAGNTTI